jgi:hypothetical protein
MSTGIHGKYPLFWGNILIKPEFSRQIFPKKKTPNIKFYENPSSSIRTDGRTDMTKLIIAFRNFCESAQ